jgi:hypothetical protein
MRSTTKIRGGLGIALTVAALAIPATAQAMPVGEDGPVQAGQPAGSQSGSEGLVLRRDGSQASDVPKTGIDAGGRITDESLYTPSVVVGTTTVAADSGSTFDWTDALIGAAVTTGILVLAMASALLARRQGRLGYR